MVDQNVLRSHLAAIQAMRALMETVHVVKTCSSASYGTCLLCEKLCLVFSLFYQITLLLFCLSCRVKKTMDLMFSTTT